MTRVSHRTIVGIKYYIDVLYMDKIYVTWYVKYMIRDNNNVEMDIDLKM